jgi:hypothetical protein
MQAICYVLKDISHKMREIPRAVFQPAPENSSAGSGLAILLDPGYRCGK